LKKKNSPKINTVQAKPRDYVLEARKRVAVKHRTALTSFPTINSSTFGGGNVRESQETAFYHPVLSKDFLELPMTRAEKHTWYRLFYKADPLIGRAIDIHTDIPLSKLIYMEPKGQDQKLNKYVLHFFEEMAEDINLFRNLLSISHEFWLFGNCFAYLEYNEGTKKWNRIVILNPDFVEVKGIPYSDKVRIEMMPDPGFGGMLASSGEKSEYTDDLKEGVPQEVLDAIEQGKNLVFETDPEEGSYVYHLARKRSPYADEGSSIIERCHLPGQAVYVKRDDAMATVNIEDLDPNTDLILSGAGNFQSFQAGSRYVENEPICGISVWKLPETSWCTADHDHEVLRNGELVRVEARDIADGDYIKVAQRKLTESLDRVDLAEYYDNKNFKSVRFGNRVIETKVIDRTEKDILVQYHRCRQEILSYEPVFNYGKSLAHRKFFPDLDSKVSRSTHVKTNSPIKRSRRYLNLDGNLGYLIGYYLGDGWTASSEHKSLSICYSTKVPTAVRSARKLKEILLRKYRFSYSEVTTDNSMVHIVVHKRHDLFSRWVSNNFGNNCDDKHLPEWIFDAPKDFIYGVLRGFLDSDGDITKKKNRPTISVRFWNTNRIVIDNIFLLCTSLGIPVSVNVSYPKNVRQPQGTIQEKCKSLYNVSFSDRVHIRRFFRHGFISKNRILKQEPSKRWNSGRRHLVHNEELYYKVKVVESGNYSGLVYSFSVNDDKSFFINNIRTFNCLRSILFRDKLRQAQTQIATRNMTPKRVIVAELADETTLEQLRQQVDMALADPDFTILVNYPIEWQEIGARERLLDIQGEMEYTENLILIGLGLPRALLTGEGTYTGERVSLEVMNTVYSLYREELKLFIENGVFKPIAKRNNFWGVDEFGHKILLYPRVRFSRLSLRDYADQFADMFNLFQKGSISIRPLLDLLNIDPEDAKVSVEEDLFSVFDPDMGELKRNLFSQAAQALVEQSDILQKLAAKLGLKFTPKAPEVPEEGGEGPGFESGTEEFEAGPEFGGEPTTTIPFEQEIPPPARSPLVEAPKYQPPPAPIPMRTPMVISPPAAEQPIKKRQPPLRTPIVRGASKVKKLG
jgi:intein/homing endonuclease